jgi:molecular chaperone DnaK (HSP70)
MADPLLAVDFGTVNSSAAIVGGDGATQLVREPLLGSWSWPSAVYLDGEQLVVGASAERRKRADPVRFRAEFKRDLGQHAPIPLGDRAFQPFELVAAVLGAVKARAERLGGAPLNWVVLTVPASYGPADPRSQDMLQAAARAGFHTAELLAEPVAAAYSPVVGAAPKVGDLILVYDFGGGTFDTCVLRIDPEGATVLGVSALDDCGGRDIDALIAGRIRRSELATLLSTPGMRPDEALRLRLALGDLARRLKHQLSVASEVEDFLLPTAPAYRLTRSEFTDLAQPPVDRTLECCRALLARLGLRTGDLTALMLVGGSTRMPLVTQTLERELGLPIMRAEDPDLAVVSGVAGWARRTADRHLAPITPPGGQHPLAWSVPDGTALLVRWLVEPGATFPAGAALARVRLADGTVWSLTAGRAGRLDRRLADLGFTVTTGQWLVLVTDT